MPEEYKDNVSQEFFDMWYIYLDPEGRQDELSAAKKKTSQRLFERAKTEIFSSGESFGKFFSEKFSNYYRDYYKPYFYAANIRDEHGAELLLKNYDYRYCLYENTLLTLFYLLGIPGIIFSCIRIFKRKNLSGTEHMFIILFFGVICTSVVSILVTEVGKRLIFDTFVPMTVVICAVLSRICGIYEEGSLKITALLAAVISAAGGFCGIKLYKSIEIPIFRDCKVSFDDNRNLMLKFSSPVPQGYVYVDSHSEEFSIEGKNELFVEYEYDDYTALPVFFGLKLPDGQHIYISYFE